MRLLFDSILAIFLLFTIYFLNTNRKSNLSAEVTDLQVDTVLALYYYKYLCQLSSSRLL